MKRSASVTTVHRGPDDLTPSGHGGLLLVRDLNSKLDLVAQLDTAVEGVRFSITARLDQTVQRVIAAIPEDGWQPIPYWSTSEGSFGYVQGDHPVSGADLPFYRRRPARLQPLVGTHPAYSAH